MAGDTAFLNASADGGATNLEGAFYAIHNGATSADQVSNERVAPVYGAPGSRRSPTRRSHSPAPVRRPFHTWVCGTRSPRATSGSPYP